MIPITLKCNGNGGRDTNSRPDSATNPWVAKDKELFSQQMKFFYLIFFINTIKLFQPSF